MEIREYNENDKESLIRLLVYLQDFEKKYEPDILEKGNVIGKELFNNLISATNKKKGKIYLAEEGGEVIGFVSGHLETVPDEVELINKNYFYISNIVLLPEYQGKGFGKGLLMKIEDYAKTLSIKQIQINVLSKNKVAYEVYKKSGFRDYESILIKEIK